MNRQDNRRTKKEGSSDLKFENFTLAKNRSWPRNSRSPGQCQAIQAPLPDDCAWEWDSAAVTDGANGHRSDPDYEEPKPRVAEAWRSMRILPARPIKESEYADTRYFSEKTDPPLSLAAKSSVPAEGQAWVTPLRLEPVDPALSKDFRSHHVKGDKPTQRNKIPLPPPPRPAGVCLPKKYQPLPPEPESSRSPFLQKHTFPEVQRRPRQISLKNLNEVLGTEKVPDPQTRLESSHLPQNQSAPEIPLAVASSSFTVSKHSIQNRGHKESIQPHLPQRCPSPARSGPQENSLCCKTASGRKPFPAGADDKGVQHKEWYIGECRRQAVEDALIKENKDGTFLVRDCSAKSQAEPYVLVVFYGSKVYNVKIRFLERNQQFALGTGLRGEEKFDSVDDIIEHYKYFPIFLIDGKDRTGTHREQCYLTQPLPLDRLFSPW